MGCGKTLESIPVEFVQTFIIDIGRRSLFFV